jgi:chromosome segregation ATPase
MLSGVVLSVISAVAAFFSGSSYLALSFFIVGGLSAIGAFYMRQFSAFSSLEDTATNLSTERERLSLISTVLEEENHTLVKTNRKLIRTNDRLEQTERRLRKQTSLLCKYGQQLSRSNAVLKDNCLQLEQSNQTLKKELTLLAVHTAQLEASSKSLQQEVRNFSNGNKELDTRVQTLSENTKTSKKLFREIVTRLNAHEAALGQNIQKLCEHFSSISNVKYLMDRLTELQLVNKQISEATGQLKALEVRSQAMASIQEAFESLLKRMQSANEDHANYNSELQKIATDLKALKN